MDFHLFIIMREEVVNTKILLARFSVISLLYYRLLSYSDKGVGITILWIFSYWLVDFVETNTYTVNYLSNDE